MEDALRQLRSTYRLYLFTIVAVIAFLWPDPRVRTLASAREEAQDILADLPSTLTELDQTLRADNGVDGTPSREALASEQYELSEQFRAHGAYEHAFSDGTQSVTSFYRAWAAGSPQLAVSDAEGTVEALGRHVTDTCKDYQGSTSSNGDKPTIHSITPRERLPRYAEDFEAAAAQGEAFRPVVVVFECPGTRERIDSVLVLRTAATTKVTPCDSLRPIAGKHGPGFVRIEASGCELFPQLRRVWPTVKDAALMDLIPAIDAATEAARGTATIVGLEVRIDQLLFLGPFLLAIQLLGVLFVSDHIASYEWPSEAVGQPVSLLVLHPHAGRWLSWLAFLGAPLSLLAAIAVATLASDALGLEAVLANNWLFIVWSVFISTLMVTAGALAASKVDAVRDIDRLPGYPPQRRIVRQKAKTD